MSREFATSLSHKLSIRWRSKRRCEIREEALLAESRDSGQDGEEKMVKGTKGAWEMLVRGGIAKRMLLFLFPGCTVSLLGWGIVCQSWARRRIVPLQFLICVCVGFRLLARANSKSENGRLVGCCNNKIIKQQK